MAVLTCNSVEWYSPSWVIEAARETMGSIDLDPASCVEANKRVQARYIYSVLDRGLGLGGLEREWFGRVFLNPPGGMAGRRSATSLWVDKAIQERVSGRVTDLIVLLYNQSALNNSRVLELPGAITFLPAKRLQYVNGATGKPERGCPCYSALTYSGSQPDRFLEVFGAVPGYFVRRV